MATAVPALGDLATRIVEQTSQGIWVLDRDDRTAFTNGRMADLLGGTPGDLQGRPVYDFVPEPGIESLGAALGRRREGVAELREIQLRRLDGKTIDVLVESSPLVDGDGVYAGSVGMVTDISARKRVERESALLAALVHSSSDAIVGCSLDGKVLSWNPAAAQLFGWSVREIRERPLATVLQAGDEGVVRLLRAAADGRLVGPLEIEAVAKDRTRIPVELTAFPVDDGLGRTTMVAVTMRDVRERREAERLMREVERARHDIERVGRLGTFEWDIQTNDVRWSDEVWHIHGRSPAGAPDPGVYMDTVHPDDRQLVHDASVAAALGDGRLDLRFRIVRPGGEVRSVHCHGEPEPGGEPPCRVIGTIRDVTEVVQSEERLKEARAELHRQALHDPLTSLPNRTLILDRLAVALAHAERVHCGVAVVVADIDRFTLVNQELGHAFGDQLLKAVGQRLSGMMRAGDSVGRLSGDEFAIVCESVEPHQQAIDSLATRVVDAFGEPFAVGGQEVYLVATAGAVWTDDVEPAEGLLSRATAALSTAKERERGSFVVARAGGEVPYAGRGRLALRHALRDALPERQLRIVYQPIVTLDGERPRAYEALLRWDHPGLGPVSPIEFIPVAEDTGLILPIGEWVIREACRTAAGLDPEVCVAVNVSPRQLMQQDLPAIVRGAVVDAGVAPERLILELTESILLEDTEQSARTLADLKRIGVKLALDDFGTGYSALGYLKRFPFDIVKVDRSFVGGLGHDEGDRAIVTAVCGMAGALGMQVVAEGVETDVQLDCLSELGVRLGQGYYFARPGPLPAAGAASEPDARASASSAAPGGDPAAGANAEA